MSAFNNFVTGYELAVLAFLFVLVYFFLAAVLLRISAPESVLVARYEPPPKASPAVAGWLFESGEMPRAMAAAVVNMASKGYLKIEQNGDLYSLTQLGPDVSLLLEPEEDALARTLFKGYDCFDFDDPTPQLKDAIKAFHTALKNTGYFSEHIAVSLPVWILSSLGVCFALIRGHYWDHGNGRGSATLLALTFGCFIVAVRTIPNTLEKIASYFPGSTAPERPWSGADSRCFTLVVAALGGVLLIAMLSTPVAAVLTAAFMVVNAIFYHQLQGPTAAGRKIIAQLAEYRKFLAEVDADRITRMNPCQKTPSALDQKSAYALAFHLDLGWGEQFVTSIADLIEYAEVFGSTKREQT